MGCAMGNDAKTSRLTDLINNHLHVYVDSRRYVAIHCYTSICLDADFLAGKIDGNVTKHKEIYDISVYNKKALKALCILVESLPGIKDELKQQLRLVSAYCIADSRRDRLVFATMLVSLLEAKQQP